MSRMCRLAGVVLGVLVSFAAAALAAASALAEEPSAGQRLFRVQCAACHSTAPGRNMVGPSLAGIVGRHSGSIAGFRYSAANQKADIVWTPERLDTYLTDPREVVPGTTMSYPGLRNEQQRKDIIAYLQTLK